MIATKTQIENFKMAMAEVVNDEEWEGEVSETEDSLHYFFAAHGRRLNRRDRSVPVDPLERVGTNHGDVYVWEGVQSRKGAARGTLYVMDVGAVRLAHFTGEA